MPKKMVPNEWLEPVNRVGDVFISLSGALQVALLGYLIFFDDNESLYCALMNWPWSVKQSILHVYAYLNLALMLLLCSLIYACHSDAMGEFLELHPIICAIGINVGLFVSMLSMHNLDYRTQYKPKMFFFVMHSMLAAPSICRLGSDVCLQSLGYTVQLLILATGVALLADKNFHKHLTYPLSKLNSIIFAASICSSVLGNPAKNLLEITIFCINIHVGLPFFLWMYTVNTQMMLCHANEEPENFDPVYIASVMLVNLLNIYVRLTTITALTMNLKKLNQL
ncbi:growth hormone-inducible transmembrane protein [Nilaparvata lugens]|uniref:growth hormone-inducible transmembrane protein n=1 Tax=Nilaparvata lugens TaxID=108931 RepID=UPI00193E4CCA|nr:growth hormone-inducible transmembrane protein [Nilaparvata lugens]